jgi:hypothetical protein
MFILRWLEPAFGLLLFTLLLTRGWAKVFPWFTAWVGGTALLAIITAFLPYPSPVYTKVDTFPQPVLTLLLLLAILRCAQETLRPYGTPRQQRQAADAVQAFGLAFAIAAVMVTEELLCPHPQWLQGIYLAWRIVSWIGAVALLLLSLWAHYVPTAEPVFLAWHRTILCACCTCVAVSLDLAVLRNHTLSMTGAYLYEVSLIASYGLWTWALLRCPLPQADAQRVPVQRVERLDPAHVYYRRVMSQADGIDITDFMAREK